MEAYALNITFAEPGVRIRLGLLYAFQGINQFSFLCICQLVCYTAKTMISKDMLVSFLLKGLSLPK